MILNYIANNNFGRGYTTIRRVQCDIFGHQWFTMDTQDGRKWCAWCSRCTGKYPKMRRHPENKGREDIK